MRWIPLFALSFCLQAALIPDIRSKLAAGDLWSADALAAEFCAAKPDSAECAAALSWLARGAQMMGQQNAAGSYAQSSLAIVEKLLKTSSLESDPYLLTALGASLETQARVLASQGKRDQAIVLLEREKSKWKLYPLASRMQKVIHVLSLEGKPAPGLASALKGKPVLFFLWAHWCGDCKAQAAALAEIRNKYGQQINILAPTRLYGSIGANAKASPSEEEAEIERVWTENYSALQGVAHPVDEETMRTYGVSSTPTLVLADRQGIVRMYRPSRLSVAELDRQIAQLLRN